MSFDASGGTARFVDAKWRSGPSKVHRNRVTNGSRLEARDALGKVIASVLMPEARTTLGCFGPPPLRTEKVLENRATGHEVTQPNDTRFLVVPANAAEQSIALFGDDGQLIDSIAVPSSAEVLATNATILEVGPQTRSLTTGTYDIVVLGHGYARTADLERDANDWRTALNKFPVFCDNSARLRLIIERTTGTLGCAHDPKVVRVIACDRAQVTARANAAGPYDHIAVFVNDGEYGGAAHYAGSAGGLDGPATGSYFTSAMRHSQGLLVAVHEFGHLLGLHDEYVYDPAWGTPRPWGPNCIASLPATAPSWAGYAPQLGYSELGWYRPDDSVMKFLSSNWFNRPSENQIARCSTRGRNQRVRASSIPVAPRSRAA